MRLPNADHAIIEQGKLEGYLLAFFARDRQLGAMPNLQADGIVVTLVYADRAEGGDRVRRIISARLSSRSERQAYEQAVRRGT